MITSKQDALVTALALAITAPNDKKADECVKIADDLSKSMDRKDVELAMKTVLDKLTESLEGTWNDK
jgi:hypothetical protein